MKKFKIFIILYCLFVIKTSAQISVNFVADTTLVCPGYNIQFTDLSVGDTVKNWHWDFGDGTAVDSIKNPTHTYNNPGFYTVSLTASSSNATQTKTKTDYIHVRDFPQTSIEYTDTLFLPSFLLYFHGKVLNDDGYPYYYFWNFDNTPFFAGDTVITHLFNNAGSHSVSFLVKAGAGCIDTTTINLNTIDTLAAPNIFTPNNDGQNDFFTIKTNGYNNFTLDIFNRWGAIVYSVTAKRLLWDGYSSAGIPLPAGIYYYHVTSSDVKGYKLSGKILLIR
ncbi:MAG: gliding motility-associated C-terminal domain-containing protein [Bacteroidales bacterium]|nr:gliding motility-associated C-terminal domain-containing protein [Bacteroidales bacterium]